MPKSTMQPRNDKIRRIEAVSADVAARLSSCDICPRRCRVNRCAGKRGVCGSASEVRVYTAFLHGGEEPALSGTEGSGTIFFSGCNLRCAYCQNYRFSHHAAGRILDPQDLARLMLALQDTKAHNINLVTPTHVLPQILTALGIALSKGLRIPIVYNTSGYEDQEIIRSLDGIIDIYLPDMKYSSRETAKKYSAAPDYPDVNQEALRLMYLQKATPRWEGQLLREGLIVRHLVLPGHVDESLEALGWLKRNMPRALVSVMFQYQPYYKALEYPSLAGRVTPEEYRAVCEKVEELGLEGWVQEYESREELAGVHFSPDDLDALLSKDN